MLLAVAAVLSLGTLGFHQLGESLGDALYRAVVTSSLTGLDSRPQGTGEELLTIGLVLAGVAIFAYVGAVIVEAIARGVVGGAWAEARRRRAIEALRDHFILCGFGRVGRRVGEEFRSMGVPYVVVDLSEEALAAAREVGAQLVEGNGTDDENLEAAGLHRARGLFACSDSDADNLYITLSARSVRDDLMIVARASDEAAARKLKLAGANRVVQPYVAAGRVMANLMLRPQVTAFLDVVTTAGGPEFRFEEIEVTRACGQSGKTIRALRLRERTGAMVIGLRKQDGTFDTTPDPDAVLDEGDVMIAVGSDGELRALEEIFAPLAAVAR